MEALQSFERAEKRLLRHILDVLAVPKKAPDNPEDETFVSVDEDLKCTLIARQSSLNQRMILRFIGIESPSTGFDH